MSEPSAKVCGTCGSDEPKIRLGRLDPHLDGLCPDAFHAKPVDTKGEMSDRDAWETWCKLPACRPCRAHDNMSCEHEIAAFKSALLAEMGERVITELNRCERTVHCDCVDATIRRMTGAKR